MVLFLEMPAATLVEFHINCKDIFASDSADKEIFMFLWVAERNDICGNLN